MLYSKSTEAATPICHEADPDANIIVGASFDESLEGIVRVSVVVMESTMSTLRTKAAPGGNRNSTTQLAGRLRNHSRRIADRIEKRNLPLPQAQSPPLRPAAGPQAGQPARPYTEDPRRAAPQPLVPDGRTSPRVYSPRRSSPYPGLPALLRQGSGCERGRHSSAMNGPLLTRLQGSAVMPGLVPGIHVTSSFPRKIGTGLRILVSHA